MISAPLPPPQLTLTTLTSPKPLYLSTTTTTTTTDSGLKFRRKLLYLQSLKLDPHNTLHQNPTLRTTPLTTLISAVSTLTTLGIHRTSLSRILHSHPLLLSSDPHQFLYPALEFLLHDLPLPFPDLAPALDRCPRLLLSPVASQLRPALNFLRELGFVGDQRIGRQCSHLLVLDVERTLVPKVEFLKSLGFSHLEAGTMVVRTPTLLTYSIERNLRPKVDYFVREMKGDLKEIKRFPQFFCFSLDRRISPRHRVLKEHGVSMPLSQMLKVSDGEFNVRLLEMRLQRHHHGWLKL